MQWIDFTQLFILANVVLAMFLSGVLGIERELAGKPAGLRTHILVGGAAALLVSLGDVMIARFVEDAANSLIRSDPIRIVEAIITGISFLGAGTIIYHRSEQSVEGLTTAASILLVAGIGLSVGLSQYTLATGVTILTLLALRGVALLQEHLSKRLD